MMARLDKSVVTKSDDLSLFPGTHTMERERTDSKKLLADFHMHLHVCAYVCVCVCMCVCMHALHMYTQRERETETETDRDRQTDR